MVLKILCLLFNCLHPQAILSIRARLRRNNINIRKLGSGIRHVKWTVECLKPVPSCWTCCIEFHLEYNVKLEALFL